MAGRLVLRTLILFTLVTLGSRTAEAQICPLVGKWEFGNRVPIYVSQDGGPFPGSPTATQLNAAVNELVAEFAEHTNANIDFYFDGSGSVPGFLAGKVVIHTSERWVDPIAFPMDTNGNGLVDRCNIFLRPSTGIVGFKTIVHHELVHCLGIHHPQECGLQEQALMGTNDQRSNGFRSYDVRNLELLYGLRNQKAVSTWNLGPSFAAWTSELQAPIDGWANARGNVSACNGFAINGGRFAYSEDGAIYYGSKGTSTIARVSSTPAGGTAATQRPAISCGPDGSFMLSWVEQPSLATSIQRHQLFQNNQVIDSTSALPSGDGVGFGDSLAGAFDPVTGRHLIAWTSNAGSALFGNTMYVWVSGQDPSHVHSGRALVVASTPYELAGRPSIACAPAALVGSNNCLVTWVTQAWRSTVMYGFGRVVLGADDYATTFSLDPSTVTDSQIVMIGTPTVAATGQSSTPWAMVGMANDTLLRAWTRGPSGSWVFRSEKSINFGFSYVSPAIMTYQYRTCLLDCTTFGAWNVFTRTFRQ